MIDYTHRGPITDLEIAAGLTPPEVKVGHPIFSFDRYGGDPTGLTDSQPAIQWAIDVCAQAIALDPSVPAYTWITELEGGTATGSRGQYRIDSKLTLKNRVSLRGVSFTSTMIVAGPGFTDNVMIDCVDGTNPIFDSRIEHIRIHANNISGLDPIHTQAWQEHCGLFHVSVDGFTSAEGMVISDVSSGAAWFAIDNCTFGPFSSAETCIHVTSAVPNAFMLACTNTTFNPSGSATSCIHLDQGRFHGENLHFETCTNGIYATNGSVLLNNITGGGSVANLVHLEGAFPSRVRIFMADKNGGTNTILHGASTVTTFVAFYAQGAD